MEEELQFLPEQHTDFEFSVWLEGDWWVAAIYLVVPIALIVGWIVLRRHKRKQA